MQLHPQVLLVALITLLRVSWCYNEIYNPPSWACSPGRPRNPLCPSPADGDTRCTFISCMQGAGCATPECNAVQGNVHPDYTLVLDAWLQRGTTCVKTTWTLSECCSLCQETPQCNAWSYCNNPAGCGSTCIPLVHNFVFTAGLDLWRLDPLEHPVRLNPDHKCLPEGQWPYQTCSLKYVAGVLNVTTPELAPGSDALDGWVSGIVPKPGQLLAQDVAAQEALAAAAEAAKTAATTAARASSSALDSNSIAAAEPTVPAAVQYTGQEQVEEQQPLLPQARVAAAVTIPASPAAAAAAAATLPAAPAPPVAAPAATPAAAVVDAGAVDPAFEDKGTFKDGKNTIYQEILQPFPYSSTGLSGGNQLQGSESVQPLASDLQQHPGLWQQQQSPGHWQQQQLGQAAAAAVVANGMAAAWHAQSGSAAQLPATQAHSQVLDDLDSSLDANAVPFATLGLSHTGGIQPLSVEVVEDGQVTLMDGEGPSKSKSSNSKAAGQSRNNSTSELQELQLNTTVAVCVFLSSLIIFGLLAITMVIVMLPNSRFTWLMQKLDFEYQRL